MSHLDLFARLQMKSNERINVFQDDDDDDEDVHVSQMKGKTQAQTSGKINGKLKMRDEHQDDNDDAWDDTELIKAYNECIGVFKKEKKKLIESKNPELTEAALPGPWVSITDGDYSFGHAPDPITTTEQEQIDVSSSEQNQQGQVSSSTNLSEQNSLVEAPENENIGATSSKSDTPKADISPKNYEEEDQERLYLLTWCVGSPCRAVYSEDGIEYEAKIIHIEEDLSYCLVRYVGYGNEDEVLLKSLKSTHGKKARDKQRRDASVVENVNYDETLLPNSSRVLHTSVNVLPESSPPRSSRGRKKSRKLQHIHFQPESQSEENSQPLPKSIERNEYSSEDDDGDGQATREQIDVRNPPDRNRLQEDWMKAFPNLFMPPMPKSLVAQQASGSQTSFGKGDLSSLLMSWYMTGYHSGYFDAKQDMKIKRQQLLLQQQQKSKKS